MVWSFQTSMKIKLKKKTEIIETVESTYGILRRVYQHLYADIADMFIEYIHSLHVD